METKKHKYQVRPGRAPKDLFIEFGPDSSDEQFKSDLRSVLKENNLTVKSNQDLAVIFIYTYDSPFGPFELVSGDMGVVSIEAGANQDAIYYVHHILSKSGRFQEKVNNEDYA